jgi:hypothetical protein
MERNTQLPTGGWRLAAGGGLILAYPAHVYRILIASPGDVEAERELAVRTIQEWNDLNSAERQIVLLPLRWETHSAPEYGSRPQEILNRQVVDHCDLLVGIFWTRIGTPTGSADSGTLEEIERVANAGRPVMLYFSNAKQDPEEIDPEQLRQLRAFKKKTFPKALVEMYSTQVEFRDKLAKQIEIQLRTQLAAGDEAAVGKPRPITDIRLHFADSEGKDLGTELELKAMYIDATNFEKVPDYSSALSEALKGSVTTSILGLTKVDQDNPNFYRQTITQLIQRRLFRPIRFWLTNVGAIGARDVYIEIGISGDGGDILLSSVSSIPVGDPSTTLPTYGLLAGGRHINTPEQILSESSSGWSSHLEIPALQPQRIVTPEPQILIGATKSCRVEISARIYADTLPQPLSQKLSLKLEVTRRSVDAKKLLEELLQD